VTRGAPVKTALALLLIAAAVFACYHRLLLPRDGGYPGWNIVKWGLKDFMYPRLIFDSDAVLSGYFPLWNPYQYGGSPWCSNFQAGLYQPLNWAVILLGGYSALALQYQMTVLFLIGGWGMFACAREFGVGRAGAAVSAVSFAGGGFFVGNGTYFPQVNTLVLLPFCLLFSRRLARRFSWSALSLGAVSFALLAAAGFPTMSFFLGATAWLTGWASGAAPGNAPRPGRIWRRMALLAAAAALLAAPLLFPAAESYSWLTRPQRVSDPGSGWETVVAGKSLGVPNFVSLAVPFVANADISGTGLWIEFRNCFLGLIPLVFAVYYLVRGRGRDRAVVFIVVTAAAALALGFTLPPYRWLYRRVLPLRLVSHPAMDFRALFLFYLSLASGMGFDLHRRRNRAGPFLLVYLGIAAAAALGLVVIMRGRDSGLPPSVWTAFAVTMLLPVLGLLRRGRLRDGLLLGAAVAEIAYWGNYNFSTIGDRVGTGFWLKRLDKEARRERRVDRTDKLARRSEAPSRDARSMFHKYRSDSGIDGTVLRPFAEVMLSPAAEVLGEDFRIRPLRRLEVLEDEAAVLERIRAGEDIAETGLAVGSDLPPGFEPAAAEADAGFESRVVVFSPNLIEYEIEARAETPVFFNEIYYPGWELVRVGGGERLPLFRLNHAFRGSVLPAGSYRLRMVFRPLWFKIGLAAAAVTAAGLVLGVAVETRRRYAAKS